MDIKDRIELIRSSVRPFLLVLATMFLFILAFEQTGVREDVVEVFKWMVVGGWSWYFGDRTVQKLRKQ